MQQRQSNDDIAEAEQLFDRDDWNRAEEIAERVLRGNSLHARALQVLGIIQSRRGRPGEAIPLLERALSVRPDLVSSHNELGSSYEQLGDPELALRHFERALILQPDHAHAHQNRALANLKLGRFREGWLEYEWRFLTGDVARPNIPMPRWDGTPLKGKSLLVHTEQGLGDVIQFARFIPLLKLRGARVVVACQQRLKPLLASLVGIDEWIPIDTETEISFDYYTPLLSLPALLRIDEEADIPNRTPYLYADAARIERWRKVMDDQDGFRVGICWQGNPSFRGDKLRSIPLSAFSPLARVNGVRLVSLQKGAGTEQIADQQDAIPITIFEDLDREGAFLDTAALIHSLDLIITSDTAVAHLAAALGRPTWLAISTSSDWRWGMERDDSPWYPTLRIFRQTDLGQWTGVFQAMAAALKSIVPAVRQPATHQIHRDAQS